MKVIDGEATPRSVGGRLGAADFSLRVAVALWEQDLESGWEFANRGHCTRNLLLELAGKLARTHLDDALSLYRRVVPALLDETSNQAYEHASDLIRKMAAALDDHRRHPELEPIWPICASSSSASATSSNCSTASPMRARRKNS